MTAQKICFFNEMFLLLATFPEFLFSSVYTIQAKDFRISDSCSKQRSNISLVGLTYLQVTPCSLMSKFQ